MSDTPETDHIENNLGNAAHPILSSFCRRLERERDEAREQREQRDRLAAALWSMLNQDHGSAIRAGILLRSLGLQSLNQPTEP